MMVKIGNFLFRFRNGLFPLFYLTMFFPSPRVCPDYKLMLALGLLVALSGQAIRVMTIGLAYIIRGGSKRQIFAKNLVTEGMFSHARNPLYLGNMLELLGLGIMVNSAVFLFVTMPLFVFFYQAIVRAEEDFLLREFGEEFHAYMAAVNRWIPRISGLGETFAAMSFNWRRVLLKEYNATFIWTAGAVVIVAKVLYGLPDRALFGRFLPVCIGALAVLATAYFIVRYLKKAKIVRPD